MHGFQQYDIAKRLFQSLVYIDSSTRRIRRPIHLSEVCAITDSSVEDVMAVVSRFSEDKCSFLTLSTRQKNTDPLIDITHESLIRQWGKLNKWLDEEAESVRNYSRLVNTALSHERAQAGLYSNVDMKYINRWLSLFPDRTALHVWSSRYNNDFNLAMNFLDMSRDEIEKNDFSLEKRLMSLKSKQLEYQLKLAEVKKEVEESNVKINETKIGFTLSRIIVKTFLFLGLIIFTYMLIS